MACSSDDSNLVPEENTTDNFDRKAMLVHWADQIIIPSYQSFNAELATLSTAITTFTANVTPENLSDARQAYRDAYLSFQHVAMFEIGAAENVRFRDRLNSYPTDTDEIHSFISTSNYDFSLPSTNDTQGFPALDYLLYGVATDDASLLEFYTTDTNAEENKEYVRAVTSTIQARSQEVLSNWQNSFRSSFIENDGPSASASVDKLTNDFVFYYEKALRAGKIGIPAGVFSNEPLPGNVEALYANDLSKQLALEALDATQGFFEGKAHTNGANGPGYDDYLEFLNTIKNGEDLSGLIRAQFATAKSEINGLNASFFEQIQTDKNAMLQAYDELQRNVILMKVDMLQALSIDVDYIDADGD